jgi:hypothetical protein
VRKGEWFASANFHKPGADVEPGLRESEGSDGPVLGQAERARGDRLVREIGQRVIHPLPQYEIPRTNMRVQAVLAAGIVFVEAPEEAVFTDPECAGAQVAGVD